MNLNYVGRYNGFSAFLISYLDKDLLLGNPLLVYLDGNGELAYVDCINDKKANRLWEEYLQEIENTEELSDMKHEDILKNIFYQKTHP